MKIELLRSVDNAKGRGFKKGDVVDWPRRDALPLILAGIAREPVDPAPLNKPRRRARKVEAPEEEE